MVVVRHSTSSCAINRNFKNKVIIFNVYNNLKSLKFDPFQGLFGLESFCVVDAG